jgi:hypothetical protein
MKIILSIFLFLFYSFNGFAQHQIHYIYGNDSTENRYISSIVDSNNNIYVLSVKRSFDPTVSGIPIEGYPTLGFTIHKLNSFGVLQWKYEQENSMPDGSRLPAKVILLKNNKIYIPYIKNMGFKNCVGNLFEEYDRNGLLCLNDQGGLLFDSLYTYVGCGQQNIISAFTNQTNVIITLEINNTNRIQKINSNGYLYSDLYTSYPQHISNFINTAQGILAFGVLGSEKKIYISNLDSNFQILSTNEIVTSLHPSLLKVFIDTNIYIISSFEVLKLSQNKNLIWNTILPYLPHSIIRTTNNTINVMTNHLDTLGVNKVNFFHLNQFGGELLQTTDNSNDNIYYSDCIVLPTGNILLGDTNCCYLHVGKSSKLIAKSNKSFLGIKTNEIQNNLIKLLIFQKQIEITSLFKNNQVYTISNLQGQQIDKGIINPGKNTIKLHNSETGFYILRISNYVFKMFLN